MFIRSIPLRAPEDTGGGGASAPPAAAPAPHPDVAALRAEIQQITRSASVDREMSAAAIADPKVRSVLAAAAAAAPDPAAYIREHAPAFARPTNPANVPNPVTPPIATGAAGVSSSRINTGDLATIDPEVLQSLPYEERMKLYENHRAKGPGHNPYAGDRLSRVQNLGKRR